MISFVINSWKRQNNIRPILNALRASAYVTEIFIWDNNPDVILQPGNTHNGLVKVVNTNCDYGLSTRFANAIFATNDCIMTQDDDICVGAAAVEQMFNVWQDNPNLMHGVSGRIPTSNNTYGHGISEGPCDMVMTGFAAMPQTYCLKYFEALHKFRVQYGDLFVEYVNTHGDDLFMSYLAMSLSGKQNMIHKIPFTELPGSRDQRMSIHHRPGHYDKRTKLMQALQEFFLICDDLN